MYSAKSHSLNCHVSLIVSVVVNTQALPTSPRVRWAPSLCAGRQCRGAALVWLLRIPRLPSRCPSRRTSPGAAQNHQQRTAVHRKWVLHVTHTLTNSPRAWQARLCISLWVLKSQNRSHSTCRVKSAKSLNSEMLSPFKETSPLFTDPRGAFDETGVL